MLLKNKVAIVTGGGRGIGKAIAKRFVGEGAAVVISARTDTEIRQVAEEIRAAGGRAEAVAGDVSREADCERIVETARNVFGSIHILVNNAGIYGPVTPIEKIAPKEWDEVIATNLRGPFLMSRLVLPVMYKQKDGAILNVTSIAGKAAFPFNSPYASSKAGLAGLTRTLAAEAAQKGVRVNAISPGPVPETRMFEQWADYLHAEKAFLLKTMLPGILQARPQTAEEIAAAAVFLVSNEAGAITGQTLNVDGGMAFY